MATREIDTARAHTELLERGSGVPLVLLHPFPFTAEVWEGEVDALSARRHVIAPSLRGFGHTAPFDEAVPPSIDAMADDVAALLDALEVTSPVVMGGLSMGGYVALAFARRHPDRLHALILADTRAEPDDAEAREKRDASIARIERDGTAELIEGMLANATGETTRASRPEVMARLRDRMASIPAEAIVKALIALRDRPDARPDLPAIRVPTLVVVGTEDTVTPPSIAEAMAKVIPRATLALLPGAGHLANVENPSAFHEAVERFLAPL
ncbi:MAG: alpha/beta fold hydrolase [Labilithrix sp.]|nr:alpha/beta fold hydrolase [Labilithrix sp.]MBX3220974.1 alpha/beta fold hydrolase [Labilithrix sp.]